MTAERGSDRNDRRLEPPIFERSVPGRIAFSLPAPGVPEANPARVWPAWALRREPAALPEVHEVDLVRHFVRLSQLNFGVDLGMYPLGSCTMKYNPKLNEDAARLPGFAQAHPAQPESVSQGVLRLMYRLEQMLLAITGMNRITLQPAAGAQGELTGMLMIRAYHERGGRPRRHVIIPDTAHGTNPASTAICGYEVIPVKSGPQGTLRQSDIEQLMTDDVAAIMLTNPNTLGLFEDEILGIAEVVHARGGLVYCDGANLNALMGRTRIGDMGVDVLHLNLHKTFSTPHGGGGPGAGPVAVRENLAPFLPVPTVEHDGAKFRLDYDRPESIGRVRSFFGNVGMAVRAYAYLLSLGGKGVRRACDLAVLNANYLIARLRDRYHLPYARRVMHEGVLSDRHQQKQGVKAIDIAKRLMDYGFHPPTIYFPLVVPGALMIEPTETEPKQEIDRFVEAMLEIADEAETDPSIVTGAPHTTPVTRLDETAANRKPILRWNP